MYVALQAIQSVKNKNKQKTKPTKPPLKNKQTSKKHIPVKYRGVRL